MTMDSEGKYMIVTKSAKDLQFKLAQKRRQERDAIKRFGKRSRDVR